MVAIDLLLLFSRVPWYFVECLMRLKRRQHGQENAEVKQSVKIEDVNP
jgi:hypothetical protein